MDIVDKLIAGVKIDEETGCWIWQGKTRSGYGHIYDPVTQRPIDTHRLSYQIFRGPIPKERPFICHTCDTPACCYPIHLFAGTPGQNTRDAASKGRMRHGEEHEWSKLTESDVGVIVARYGRGESVVEIARDFGITKANVWKIAAGRTWRLKDRNGVTVRPAVDKGELNPQAKLKVQDVLEIRAALAAGEDLGMVAAKYKISKAQASRIHTRKKWKHIP